MVQLSSTTTLYLFFVLLCYRYKTEENFLIIFTCKGFRFPINDLGKEDNNR